MAEKKFYITTPIFYPNAKLHLGHAYTTTISDILARYHRIAGDNTYLLTGADENTQKVVQSAKAAGVKTKPFLDGIVSNFKDLFAKLNISYDQFIRTSDEKAHWPGAIELWKKLDAAGDLYKKEYEGLYCIGHEAFITEKELVNGKCPDHGTVPELLKEENYFFKLSRYTQAVKEKIESDEIKIVPQSRKNEILSLLREGLDDVSFSRPKTPASVGIPVPADESQVMYVWCDALSNYITALGYGQNDKLYKEFWPADLHVIGKDILRFHAAIWPAMLLSAGLPLPKSLLVHGFITSGGKKMSKTLGNVIDPEELLAEYGTDAVRYYLARHISPFDDGDITREHFKEIYNGELANGLGNLVARIMTLAEKNLERPVFSNKNLKIKYSKVFEKAFADFDIRAAIEILWINILNLDQAIVGEQGGKPFDIYQVSGARSSVLAMNEALTREEPYKLIKQDQEKGRAMIEGMVKELYWFGKAIEPFLPATSEKIIEAVITNKKPENLFARKD